MKQNWNNDDATLLFSVKAKIITTTKAASKSYSN